MKVKCTAPWWHNNTYYRAGDIVEVKPGTSIPQGFFVDGIEVPRRKKPVVETIDSHEREHLQAQIDSLQAMVKSLTKEEPRRPGRPPGQKE